MIVPTTSPELEFERVFRTSGQRGKVGGARHTESDGRDRTVQAEDNDAATNKVFTRADVEDVIRHALADVDCDTVRRGSPHSFVCTKNQASYCRRVAQRKQDLADMAILER